MAPDLVSLCRLQLDFMRWADELMLAAVASNMPDQIGTLQHIYLAEKVWLARIRGQKDIVITDLEAPPDLAALQEAWPLMHRSWLDWASVLHDAETVIPHRNAAGVEFRMPAWQVVLHLVNHGSFHRGQVATMLRSNGFVPPTTDLIVYYRTRA